MRPLLPTLLAALLAACGPTELAGPVATPTSALVVASPSASDWRSDFPVLPQETTVAGALQSIGVTAEFVGASRFASALGSPLPARLFRIGPHHGGADILFLDGPRDIRVCASAGSPGRTIYTIFVDGRETARQDSAQYVAFLVSAQYFVMAWSEATTSAVQSGLGVAPARC